MIKYLTLMKLVQLVQIKCQKLLANVLKNKLMVLHQVNVVY